MYLLNNGRQNGEAIHPKQTVLEKKHWSCLGRDSNEPLPTGFPGRLSLPHIYNSDNHAIVCNVSMRHCTYVPRLRPPRLFKSRLALSFTSVGISSRISPTLSSTAGGNPSTNRSSRCRSLLGNSPERVSSSCLALCLVLSEPVAECCAPSTKYFPGLRQTVISWRMKVIGWLPIACTSPMLQNITSLNP